MTVQTPAPASTTASNGATKGNNSTAQPDFFVDTPYSPGDPMFELTAAYLADPCE